jgi:integrase
MIVTFLLTGARLREIVHLEKGDIDLHQATIRLHRKGGEVNILPLADSAMVELKAYLKQRRRRNRTKALFISAGIEGFRLRLSGTRRRGNANLG